MYDVEFIVSDYLGYHILLSAKERLKQITSFTYISGIYRHVHTSTLIMTGIFTQSHAGEATKKFDEFNQHIVTEYNINFY